MRARLSIKVTISFLIILLTLSTSFLIVDALTGSTVGTSTRTSAVDYPFQRKSFYANGRFWVFWYDGSNMVYSTSTDGVSWTTKTTVRACAFGSGFSVWFDGTYLHYAYAYSSSIYYRRGMPNADGSITWSADEQTVTTLYNTASLPMVSVDSDGYPWIGYREYGSDLYQRPYVIKSSRNDGVWQTASGFPFLLSSMSDGICVSIIPLTNLKMLAVYGYAGCEVYMRAWNGSGWKSEIRTSSFMSSGFYHSAVAQGDDVHIVFLKSTTYDIQYVKYTYSSNSFGTETTLVAGATRTSAPVISINTATNDLYVFAATKTTGTPSGWTANHIYYIKYTASTGQWSSWTDWIDETSEQLSSADRLSCFYRTYGNYIGLMYLTKTARPYNVKFAFLSLVAKTWHDIASWVLTLLTRKWNPISTFNLNLQSRAWLNIASYNLNMQTRTWQTVTSWTQNIITRIWHAIATWTFELAAGMVKVWHEIASWTTTILTKTWHTAASWTHNIITYGWHTAAAWTATVETAGKAFPFIILIGAIFIVAVSIYILRER